MLRALQIRAFSALRSKHIQTLPSPQPYPSLHYKTLKLSPFSTQLRHNTNKPSPQSYSPFASSSAPTPTHLRPQNYEPPAPGELMDRFGPGQKAIAAAFAVAGLLFVYSSLDLGRSANKAVRIVDELKGMSEEDFIIHEMRKAHFKDLGIEPPLPPSSYKGPVSAAAATATPAEQHQAATVAPIAPAVRDPAC